MNRIHKSYTLTDEQENCVNLAVTGKNLKIEAFAGGSKTYVMSAIATAMPDKTGLYIAFNKATQLEAEKEFPRNVTCKTIHALAYRPMSEFYGGFSKMGSRLKSRLTPSKFASKYKTSIKIAFVVMRTITKFCNSADPRLTEWHIKNSEYYKTKKHVEGYESKILKLAKKYWSDMTNPNKTIPITHDVYLKLWVLSKPVLYFDFILFDEAQDSNDLNLQLVELQNAQKVFVGDNFQEIYQFRGSSGAMDKIKTHNTATLSKSFRFGQSIADLASETLNDNLGANVSIKGFEQLNTVIQPCKPDVIICRSNRGLISYLLEYTQTDKQVYVEGGVKNLKWLINSADNLLNDKKPTHPDIAIFESFSDLEVYSESSLGTDLKLIVSLVLDGSSSVLNAINDVERTLKSNADITLTTTHKAKGLEWDNVKLADDFKSLLNADKDKNGEIIPPDDAEINILYVALTRAKLGLDISDCSALIENKETH